MRSGKLMELCPLFHPGCLDGVLCGHCTIRLQNVGEFHEAGFCSSVRIDCANSHKEFPHGTVTPRGGSEDHSDTSEQSSSTNDRSSNATNAPSSTSSNQPRRRGSRGGQGGGKSAADWSSSAKRNPEELPEPMREGRLGSPEARRSIGEEATNWRHDAGSKRATTRPGKRPL